MPKRAKIKIIIRAKITILKKLRMFKKSERQLLITFIMIFIKGMDLNSLVILSTLKVLIILKDLKAWRLPEDNAN